MTDLEFEEYFNRYMTKKREEMREKFNRVLPSGEYIFNRFDKARYLECGKGSSVYDTTVVMGDVTIGENVWIGPFAFIEGFNGKIEIGDYVAIGSGTMISTHDSSKNILTSGKEPVKKGNVKIGNNTIIHPMVMISCGVSIGNHCIIGTNSFVNDDVPDNSIVAGNPAKIIGAVKINEDGKVEFCYK